MSWTQWSVDFASTFDAANYSGTSGKDSGQVGADGDGKGPSTPIEGGKAASEVQKIFWSSK